MLKGKKKAANQEYCTWQSSSLELKDKDIPKQRLGKFLHTRPTLQEMMRGVFQMEMKSR